MANYRIDLGISLNQGDLGKIKTQLNNFQNQKKIELEINRTKIDNQLNSIRKQIQNLSNIKIDLGKNGSSNFLSLNTAGLDASLQEVATSIKAIKNALGTLDDGGEMKSLLSSVNQISTALDKASGQFAELNAQLSALAKKDFSINVGIDMNKKNLSTIGYGRAARKQVIPELESQIKYLEDLFGGKQAVIKQFISQGKNIGFDIFTDFDDFNSDTAIRKMEAMEKYISSLKKLATINNVSLDGFDKIHKDASALIDDIAGVENAVDKAGDVPAKLRNLFGGSVDGESLSKQLDLIVADLGEIKTVIQGLSQNNAIDGLTQSFNKLSDTLDKLMKNARLLQNVFGDVGSGTNTGVGDSLEQQSRQTQEFAQETQQAARQITDAYNQMAKGASTVSQLEPLNLKDDISEADELAAALSKLKNIQGNIKNIDIGNLDTSKGIQELQTLENQLESLSAEYNETVAEINSKGGVSKTQWQSVQNEIANTELRLEQLNAKLREDIKLKINTDIAKNIQKAHSDFDKLSVKTVELKQKLDLLDSIQVDLDTAAANNDLEGLKTGYQNYLRVLKDVKAQIDINKQAERDAAASAKLEDDRILFHNKIDSWLAKNSAAAKQFGGRLREMQAEVKNCDRQTLNRLEAELKQIDKAAEGAGKKTKTFGDSLKQQLAKYSSYFSVASLFMYAEQGLRSMFEQVKLIDSAMTELKKVTNETDATYKEFLTNAATRSREIGTTIDGLVSSTADFARLGYGFKDAQGLAEVANIYAVVGDEIEGVEGATESLISTMAAFKDEMNGMSNTDFAMSIIDKFNEIGNNFAISSGGIGEALERSASSLMAANNTIDESIALITAANTVVQDPEQVGKWLADIKSGYIG